MTFTFKETWPDDIFVEGSLDKAYDKNARVWGDAMVAQRYEAKELVRYVRGDIVEKYDIKQAYKEGYLKACDDIKQAYKEGYLKACDDMQEALRKL